MTPQIQSTELPTTTPQLKRVFVGLLTRQGCIKLLDFSLSSIGWRRGLGRGGAFLLVTPLLVPLPARSSQGEDGELDAALLTRPKFTPALIVAALALALVASSMARAAEANTLTDAEQKAGWKLLFDGKTTTGWRGYKMDKLPPGWAAENGALVRVHGGAGGKGAGGGDDIVTTQEFESFDLSLEWKVKTNGNSGVLYHVSEEAVTTWHFAPEVQILDNRAHPTRSKLELAGACYDLYAPAKDVTKPPGEWNQMRILVKGPHVEHWMNGEKMVEYELWSDDWKQRVAKSKHKEHPKFGTFKTRPICLQDHSDRVEFRNIKIRRLP